MVITIQKNVLMLQEVRDTFCAEAKKLGHEIDLINLHDEKPLPFYDGSNPSEQILNYRKRLEKSDVLFMISPCYNLRATAILENFIDLVLAPKWFFSFKKLWVTGVILWLEQ